MFCGFRYRSGRRPRLWFEPGPLALPGLGLGGLGVGGAALGRDLGQGMVVLGQWFVRGLVQVVVQGREVLLGEAAGALLVREP